MRKLIVRSAFLHLCECRAHGTIVLADGKRGAEFCSKETARAELDRLFAKELVSETELLFLKDEISKLNLPLDGKIDPLSWAVACRMLDELDERDSPPQEYVM
jgi:hypothetical protein